MLGAASQELRLDFAASSIQEDDMWDVISAWFDEKGLASQQIDSYNRFINITLKNIMCNQRVIEADSPVCEDGPPEDRAPTFYRHSVEFTGVDRPHLRKENVDDDENNDTVISPYECRLRNITYAAAVSVRYQHVVKRTRRGETKEIYRFEDYAQIAELPVMVRSSFCELHEDGGGDGDMQGDSRPLHERVIEGQECIWDHGGYFIVNGGEKVLITQESMRNNHVFVFPGKREQCHSYKAEVLSVRPDGTNSLTRTEVFLLRKDFSGHPKGTIVVSIPYIGRVIPLFIVFRALGIHTEQSIIGHIVYDPDDNDTLGILRPSLMYARSCSSEKQAQLYIGNRATQRGAGEERSQERVNLAIRILTDYFLPHVGTTSNEAGAKAFFLGYMVQQMLGCSLGRRPLDDRDHIANKRLKLAGTLMSQLFRGLVLNTSKKIKSDMEFYAKNHYVDPEFHPDKVRQRVGKTVVKKGDIKEIIERNGGNISASVNTAFATGNWRTKPGAEGAQGVSQTIIRQTYLTAISSVRRLQSQIDSTSKSVEPRTLHSSQFGYICPAETPEGHQCGIVKSLAMMCYVTTGSSGLGEGSGEGDVQRIILNHPSLVQLNMATLEQKRTGTSVFIDGNCFGFVEQVATVAPEDESEYQSESSYSFGDSSEELSYSESSSTNTSSNEEADSVVKFEDKLPEKKEKKKHRGKSFDKSLAIFSDKKSPIDMLETDLKEMRRRRDIPYDISIHHDRQTRELKINTDEGRVCRPLLIVDMKDFHLNRSISTKTYKNIDIRLQRGDINYIKNYFREREMGQKNEEMFRLGPDFDPFSLPYGQTKKKESPWSYLLSHGIIEYIDAEEEEGTLVLMDFEMLRDQQRKAVQVATSSAPVTSDTFCLPCWTHVEIHPSMILSCLASIIPFPDHNQSPRNCYQCSMGKQAIGIYSSTFQQRMDSNGLILHHLQVPLMPTIPMNYVLRENYRYKTTKDGGVVQVPTKEEAKNLSLPAGQNAIIAIMCYTGYNQEDSVVMNLSAVDRGIFRATAYRTYKDTEGKDEQTTREKFKIPDPYKTDGMNFSSGIIGLGSLQGTGISASSINPQCRTLDEDGLSRPGEAVKAGDIVIGKTVPSEISETRSGPRVVTETDIGGVMRSYRLSERDASTRIRNTETGRVDTVLFGEDKSGNRIAAVKVRNQRIPQVGDKFSSRHGQKGTVGMLLNQADMPYTFADGITPDIIINPHAIPSRMTIGQLLECLCSKVSAIKGARDVDATPFCAGYNQEHKVENIAEALHKLGYQRFANERMINGMSGRVLNALVFIGPTFYQRLKHMVIEKVHARARGEITMATRSPVEGRSRGGALRMGNMERDCLLAHGVAAVIRERFLKASDLYSIPFCKECGFPSYVDTDKKLTYCRVCEKYSTAETVDIPFAFYKLILDLMSMGISPRMFISSGGADWRKLDAQLAAAEAEKSEA